MRICDDPSTGLPLVDNTKYYFKLRSFRSWMDRSLYYDSNEYSATAFQGGWQFPDYISIRPTETIAASVTLDWINRSPATTLVEYEVYRSTDAGFTDRTYSNRVFATLTAATVTAAQGQKVVSNSAAARIMTFNASPTNTIVLSGASAGTWSGTDYFQIGDVIYITGSYNGNNGAKTITNLSGVTMTVAETLYAEIASLNPIIQIYKLTSKSSSTRAFTIAAGKTITVGAGQAWTTIDGFAVGDVVDISGCRYEVNNGTKTINTLTATVMTVNEPMMAEVTPTSTSVVTTRIFTFAATGNTLTATGSSPGSFITDGHYIGGTIYVANSVSNPGPFTISNLTATVMTFNETPVNETCPAGTIVYRRVTITLRAPVPGTRYYYRFRKYNFNSIAALQCSSPGYFLITNRAVAANVATITTAVAHGFIVGQSVTIDGLFDIAYNGTFTISAVASTTTFAYALTHGAESVADIGRVISADIRTTYRSVSTNVATLTTNIPHKFVVNQSVVVSGMTDATYNGTFKVVSVPSTTTFTYALTHNDETATADTSGTIKNITLFSAACSRNITVATPVSISTVSKTFTFAPAGNTITVAGGSWTTDGHSVWDTVVITGSAAGNNGTFTISALTSTVMTVLETVYTEVGDADPVITITGNTYALVTTTIAHGLVFGQTIIVSGFSEPAYNGTFTVRAVPTTTSLSYPVVHSDAAITDDNAGKISNTALDFDKVYYLSGFRFDNDSKYITNLVNNIYNSMFAPGIEISGPGIAAGTKVVSVDPSGREMIIDTNTTTSTDTIFATTLVVTKRSILSNVATIVTNVAHNLYIGAKIRLTEMEDSSYNGTYVITVVPSATRLKFALTHADELEKVNATGVLTVVDIVLTIPAQAGMGVYGAIGTTEGILAGTTVVSKENSYMVTLSQTPTFATSYTIATFQTFTESAELTAVPNLYAKSMNFCLQASDFATTWVNNNLTVGANTYEGPIMNDWTTGSMDSLTAAADNATRTMTVTGLKPATTYTASVYVRADQTLTIPNGVSGRLSFGSTNTDFIATNEIKRYSATATTASGVTSLDMVIRVNNNTQVIHASDANVHLGSSALGAIATTTTAIDLFPCATPLVQLRSYCRNKVFCGTDGNQGIEVNIGTAATGEFYHEIHVSTTPGFIPSASTLATNSYASDTSHITFVAQANRNKIMDITKIDAGSSAAALGVLYFTGTSTDNVILNGNIDIQYCNSATIPIIYFLTAAHNNLIHNIDFGRVKSYQAANFIFTQSTNSVTGNRIQNIRANNYDVPISNQMQNTVIKGLPSGRAVPAVGATTYAIGGTTDGIAAGATGYVAVYDSQFSELYQSSTEGLLCIAMEESQKSIKPYIIKSGNPRFSNKGHLEMIEANSVSTINRARNNNIATITTSLPHKASPGDEIYIYNSGGIGYDGIQTVATTASTTQLTYACVGDNEIQTSTSSGIVNIGDSIEWEWPYKLKGIVGFRKLLPKILTTDMGTQTDIPDGLKIEISVKTDTVWSDYIEATSYNLDTFSFSPTIGFNLKVKLTAQPFMKYGTMTNPIYPGDIIRGTRSSVTAKVINNYNYGLTGTLILNNISGTFLPLEILVLDNNTSRTTTNRSVTTNVATITTNSAHGMAAGYWVKVTNMTDSSYNGIFVVASAPTSTTFTYALTHANEGGTSDTAGTIYIYRNLATNVATNGFAMGPSFTSLVNVIQLFTKYNNQNTLYPSLVYPLVVNIVDSFLNPIEGARVRVTATDTVGGYTEGDVILTGLTNIFGSISIDIESLVDIPVSIRARKSTNAPYYKPSDVPATFVGGIGLNTTLVLVLDQ